MAMLAAEAAQIDTIVRTVMREEHIAALSIGIGRNGKTLYLKGFGYRDVERRGAADGYTIYRAGSITKQFTAAAIMQLVDRSAMTLDATAGRFLPSLPPSPAAVTIAELLNQTSGIPSYTDAGATFATAIGAPLLFPAGTSWEYSNTNYYLLGRILEAQTHETYAQLLRGAISGPLRLSSTAYGVAPYAQNVARGYRYDGERYVPFDDDGTLTDRVGAAAAIATNAPDLLKWLDALRTGRVVSPASFAAMTRSFRLPSGASTHYGYGFFVRNWYGWHTVEHPGHIDGFSADDALVLDDGLEIAILSNSDRVDLVPLTQSIVAIVDPPKDANMLADRPRPPENEDPNVTATVHALVKQLEAGEIDRTLLTQKFSSSFTVGDLRADTATLYGLGEPLLVEFTERTRKDGIVYDRYRVTFTGKRLWMTIGYDQNHKTDALSFEPDND